LRGGRAGAPAPPPAAVAGVGCHPDQRPGRPPGL